MKNPIHLITFLYLFYINNRPRLFVFIQWPAATHSSGLTMAMWQAPRPKQKLSRINLFHTLIISLECIFKMPYIFIRFNIALKLA